MAGHLEYLEHEGGELFSENKKPVRKLAKKEKLDKEIAEKLKEESLAEKQRKYLSPENPALWEGDFDA